MSLTSYRPETELTPEEQRLAAQRGRIRAALKKHYVKEVTDPHKHGQGGYLFDPAVQRFMSMRANYYEYFRPTHYGFFRFLGYSIFPMLAYGYFIYKDRTEFERKCRNGEIPYEARLFKRV